MTPKVSVIVPVYNSSKYIAKCCRSLFEQTLDSLQFIFVDDGSNDGSLNIVGIILNEYPNRRNQVVFVYRNENRGVGAARHIGLREASGEYIIFCDSDDWVESDLYEKLYLKAHYSNADIVNCGFKVDSIDGVTSCQVFPLNQTEPLLFSISPKTGALWVKLIKRSFLEKNRLEIPSDIIWGEDLCLSIEALLLSEKTQHFDELLYHHVINEGSLTHSVTKRMCLDLIKCGHIIESFLKAHSLIDSYSFQLNWLKFQLKQYLLIFPQTRDIQMWKSVYPECHVGILRYQTAFYLKVSAWLLVHNCDRMGILVLKMRDVLSSLKH